MDQRFTLSTWTKLAEFSLEVDPGFSAMTTESLIVNMVGDVLTHSTNLSSLKVKFN